MLIVISIRGPKRVMFVLGTAGIFGLGFLHHEQVTSTFNLTSDAESLLYRNSHVDFEMFLSLSGRHFMQSVSHGASSEDGGRCPLWKGGHHLHVFVHVPITGDILYIVMQ